MNQLLAQKEGKILPCTESPILCISFPNKEKPPSPNCYDYTNKLVSHEDMDQGKEKEANLSIIAPDSGIDTFHHIA